jgi:hypothetical protein
MSVQITTTGTMQVSPAGSISLIDPTGVQQPLLKAFLSVIASLSASTFGQATLSTTPTVVSLPANPTQLFYAANLQTGKAGSTNTITVTWTPVGAASVEILVLQPQSVLFFFNPGAGISALTVVASGANTVVDYLLAG